MITNTGIATIATATATTSSSDSHNFQRPDLPVLLGEFDVVFIVKVLRFAHFIRSFQIQSPAAERHLSLARRFNAGKPAIVLYSRGATVDLRRLLSLFLRTSFNRRSATDEWRRCCSRR